MIDYPSYLSNPLNKKKNKTTDIKDEMKAAILRYETFIIAKHYASWDYMALLEEGAE